MTDVRRTLENVHKQVEAAMGQLSLSLIQPNMS